MTKQELAKYAGTIFYARPKRVTDHPRPYGYNRTSKYVITERGTCRYLGKVWEDSISPISEHYGRPTAENLSENLIKETIELTMKLKQTTVKRGER